VLQDVFARESVIHALQMCGIYKAIWSELSMCSHLWFSGPWERDVIGREIFLVGELMLGHHLVSISTEKQKLS